ncbi:MAG: 30S ribosomal protein S3 [Victivallaceae bacterium]|nr:30S ribosomal protein S3 [Victivallaceae bacterium]
MGQKVNPIGLRTALTRNWESRWFADPKENRGQLFGKWLHEDLAIRKFVKDKYDQEKHTKAVARKADDKAKDDAKDAKKSAAKSAGGRDKHLTAAIARVEIERSLNKVRVKIHAARPGVILGSRRGTTDELAGEIKKLVPDEIVEVEVIEVRNADTNAQLVAEGVAMRLERRITCRRAMKQAIQLAMEGGVDGIKVNCAGRIGGAEIAREEQYKEGRVPLHTLNANIDYGFAEANTTAGKIGVKVWVCHKDNAEEEEHAVNAKKSKVQKGTARK